MQVSRPAGLGGQLSSRVRPQRQGIIAQVPGVHSLGRNLPLAAFELYVVEHDCPRTKCLCLRLQHTMPHS